MVSLVVTVAVVGAVFAMPTTSNWWMVVAAVVPGIWVAVARTNTRRVRAELDRRLQAVERGDDEQTRFIAVSEVAPTSVRPSGRKTRHEMSVDLSKPVPQAPSLSAPLPMSPQTYVSQPVLPRSMRTVDLSAGGVSGKFPVAAENPQDVLPFELDEAVGAYR